MTTQSDRVEKHWGGGSNKEVCMGKGEGVECVKPKYKSKKKLRFLHKVLNNVRFSLHYSRSTLVQTFLVDWESYIHISELYIHILELYIHISELYIHISELYIHNLKLQVHILELYIHILELYIHNSELCVHISELYVHIQFVISNNRQCVKSNNKHFVQNYETNTKIKKI